MGITLKVKFIRNQEDDYLKVPLGKIRLDHRFCKKFSIKRNDFIKIIPENLEGKTLIRQVFMSANIGINTCILDYDSVNLLSAGEEKATIKIKKIKKLSFMPSVRYFLFSDPDLAIRRAYQLAVISLLLGIISLIISLSQ